MPFKRLHTLVHHPRVQRAIHHPLFLMWAFVVFSLGVKECYPFSHFPMYSNLASGSHYFYLADENDDPVSVKLGFGMAASSMKKMYHSHLTPMAGVRSEEAGKRIKASELGPEDQALAGEKLFDYLMPRGEKRRWWRENHPKTLRLIRVDIKRSGKELSEDARLIYGRAIPDKIEKPEP